ncbi:D-amino acid dehydrogenase small subunit [Kaistia algarum]|uniref:D-amino acid dehydrogenase n=1 Tax=Kaistia algarum TaxID=2083279 RepID=UPI000CE84F09|nr:D-amino acid dehydrogenase [Kaistia algarum]MCX5514424.1 D-amino acid dehydrogenase [Kaistia algarum]PPE79161.1 D-amino acid dehydrogenase small subunit [Kaistia algarum]
MKVIVLGAGVIGVTTAYYLAKAGHEVEVIDRQAGPALETSFANAGQVSPGYASPWAASGIPQKAVKWLMMKHPPLILRPQADPAMLDWLVRMLANCTAPRYEINKARMVRVAEYSRDVLKALRADTGIAYDERTGGTLQLFREQKQVEAAAKDIAVLKQYGVGYEVLDRQGCLRVEPGLAGSAATIAGGLRLPGDETGDCQMFTTQLAAMAEALGVTFRMGTTIHGLRVEGGQVASVQTSAGTIRGDRYVLAMGSFSPILGRTVGLRLPIYPVKGYSITAPVVADAKAPVSTVLDESYKIAITRLGDRIRVGGMAEISGYNNNLSPKRRDTLAFCVNDLFPDAGDTDKASFWTGLRPMTPDGTPILGQTKLGNLTINSGHGTLGWTMACGSARVVADLISGTKPDIDIRDLGPERYA